MPETTYVPFGELRLPPRELGRHGPKDDADYVRGAQANVERAAEHAGLNADSRVLDIGCGAGRFLIGMLATYGRVNRYVGMDVRRHAVDWCSEHLADPAKGDIEFVWLDLANTRYNRHGDPIAEGALPVDDGAFDVIVLFSVFSHMTPGDTEAYLREIRRALAPGGRCYCTAFVEDGVPDWQENPADYHRDWKGPLHCTRFNRGFFDAMVERSGLRIEEFLFHHHQGKQSSYILGDGSTPEPHR